MIIIRYLVHNCQQMYNLQNQDNYQLLYLLDVQIHNINKTIQLPLYSNNLVIDYKSYYIAQQSTKKSKKDTQNSKEFLICKTRSTTTVNPSFHTKETQMYVCTTTYPHSFVSAKYTLVIFCHSYCNL